MLPESLRQALIAARMAKDLSQARLGELVGLPQTHISGIETGRIVPRYDTLLDLVRVLNYDLVLVPRSLVPVVEALSRENQRKSTGGEDRPLYEVDEEESSEEAEALVSPGRRRELGF